MIRHPILKKMLKHDKIGRYFPAFSFFSEHCFGIFMKTIMGTANMTFSKTAHIIQLSIHVPDAMFPIGRIRASAVPYPLYSQGT